MKTDGLLNVSSAGNEARYKLRKMIKPCTKVLEFGCGEGWTTKYLQQSLNCEVYVVESDELAGKEATSFAKDYLFADIEACTWVEKFQDVKFDYVLLHNILGRLHNPQLVMEKIKNVLKEDGSVLLSIPNIAHNSVMINLLNNKFEYVKTGLLDDIYARFFTVTSLEKLFDDLQYFVANRQAVYIDERAATNEFHNDYTSVKGIGKSFWNKRDYGKVYQFVYELKMSEEYVKEQKNDLVKNTEFNFFQIFLGNSDDLYSENRSIKKNLEFGQEHLKSVISLENHADFTHLRIDPLNGVGIVVVNHIFGVSPTGRKKLEIANSNASLVVDSTYFFTTNDPRFYFAEVQRGGFTALEIDIEYKMVESPDISYFVETALKSREELSKEFITLKKRYMFEQTENKQLKKKLVQLDKKFKLLLADVNEDR